LGCRYLGHPERGNSLWAFVVDQLCVSFSRFLGAAFGLPLLILHWLQHNEGFINMTVSILAEIPEELHGAVAYYLEKHANWDQDRLFVAALSLFLLQNVESDSTSAVLSSQQAARVYLDSVFQHPV
jgi:hypothetical protein